MKILLDTNVLLWVAIAPEQIPQNILDQIQNPSNEVYFSAASIWEISIKNALGKPDFSFEPAIVRQGLIDNGYHELTINSLHTIGTGNLPPIHRDPFDRILIAQAISENMLLVTADQTIIKYPAPVMFMNKIS